MAQEEDRAHAQHVDRLRQKVVGCGGVDPPTLCLQFFDHAAGDGLADMLGVDAKVEPRQSVRHILRARQIPHNVEQFLLRQADQGPAQQRTGRQRVPSVRQDARDRDEILNLLPTKQAFPDLSRERNAAPLQRFLIAPEITSRLRSASSVFQAGRDRRTFQPPLANERFALPFDLLIRVGADPNPCNRRRFPRASDQGHGQKGCDAGA
jgi:hypothetical protein